MNKHFKRVIIVVAAACLAAGIMFGLAQRSRQARQDAALFAGATNIVFTKWRSRIEGVDGFESQPFTVSESNEVARFVAAIRLRRKKPCLCGQHSEAVFQRPSGPVFVSFCKHCFDVLGATNSYAGAQLYWMPKDFYAAFERRMREQEFRFLSGTETKGKMGGQ